MRTPTRRLRRLHVGDDITLNNASKEKHSLTRKLVGCRNWRQRWCKKEGNKVMGKEK